MGITGHRWNKIPTAAAARITEQLSSVFAVIDLSMKGGQRSASAAQAPAVRLVSGLAEGADQLAIASRPDGWVLHAILPFPRARYLEDFAPARATGGVDRRSAFEAALAQARSIVELPDSDDAVRGYERAGEALLQESDLLVAVWDGQAAAGRGGTEVVVTRALSLGMPVVWICSGHDRAPTLLSARPDARQPPDAVPASEDAIRRTVESIIKTLAVAPPPIPAETRTS